MSAVETKGAVERPTSASSREYVVLEADADVFNELARVTATSAEQACRRAAEGLDKEQLEHGVKLAAIPARHWRPRMYRNRTETRLVAS